MKPGTLYLVATPIGNLDDLTFRAVSTLREVDVIACEDTRHTRALLNRYGIQKPLVSYHEHNEQRRARELVARLLAGESVALVSDAGMPVLSDPGYEVVRQAINSRLSVVAIPGPSAITTALVVSGLPPDRFLFVGFLPRKSSERRRTLSELAPLPWTLVMFEAPHRIKATLADLHTVLGDRQIALTRELTKRFEEVVRGTVTEVLYHVGTAPPRGELTLVIGGARLREQPHDVASQLTQLLAGGTSPKDAVRVVAQAHRIPKRVVYGMALDILRKRE